MRGLCVETNGRRAARSGIRKCSKLTAGSSDNALSLFVQDSFSVFLEEWPFVRSGKDVENHFRRAAEACAERRDYERTVDKDRILKHRVEKLVVTKCGIIQS